MSTWTEGDSARDTVGSPPGTDAGPGGPYAEADPALAAAHPGAGVRADEASYGGGQTGYESSQEKADRASIGELVGDISQGLSTLLRQEVELAKAEVRESATRAGRAAGQFGGAALAGWMALLFLSVAVWEWLSGAIDNRGWAAVIVMAVWAIVAAILTASGRRTARQIQGLPRTAQTAKQVPDALKGNEEIR